MPHPDGKIHQGATSMTLRAADRAMEHRSGFVNEQAADVAAVQHVPVALVDLVERVPVRDQLVELELPRLVQLEQLRDRVERVAAAEQRALDPLLEQRELETRQLDGLLA